MRISDWSSDVCFSDLVSELGIDDLPVVSIAKGPDRDAGRERFFMAGREPFLLERRDPVLYFLQRLRDEAHRFAIETHRARRTKALGRSEEHTSDLQSLMRISYAVFCLKKKTTDKLKYRMYTHNCIAIRTTTRSAHMTDVTANTIDKRTH